MNFHIAYIIGKIRLKGITGGHLQAELTSKAHGLYWCGVVLP